MQAFCEEHLAAFVPFARRDGELATALQAPLDHLMRRGKLELYPLQDSPSRAYAGERRWRGIRVRREVTHDD